MRTRRPPLNPEKILAARMRKGLTQEDVQRECAARGVNVWNVSRMESGDLKWPHPRVVATIAEVLGIEVGELLETGKAAA
jgi:hypothetical protein